MSILSLRLLLSAMLVCHLRAEVVSKFLIPENHQERKLATVAESDAALTDIFKKSFEKSGSGNDLIFKKDPCSVSANFKVNNDSVEEIAITMESPIDHQMLTLSKYNLVAADIASVNDSETKGIKITYFDPFITVCQSFKSDVEIKPIIIAALNDIGCKNPDALFTLAHKTAPGTMIPYLITIGALANGAQPVTLKSSYFSTTVTITPNTEVVIKKEITDAFKDFKEQNELMYDFMAHSSTSVTHIIDCGKSKTAFVEACKTKINFNNTDIQAETVFTPATITDFINDSKITFTCSQASDSAELLAIKTCIKIGETVIDCRDVSVIADSMYNVENIVKALGITVCNEAKMILSLQSILT